MPAPMTTLTDALAAALNGAMADYPAAFIRETRPGHFAEHVLVRLRERGVVIFESREALTAALAEALETVYWPDEQAGAERDFAAAILADLLPEANHE